MNAPIERRRDDKTRAWLTWVLIAANVAIFLAMLRIGAGLGPSSNAVQLAWGANFGPATADGEWWRLGSAMFLHFGLLHLVMNMLALWDGGRLVERYFGPARFAVIYVAGGVAGNLLSLVAHGDQAVAGGASGAIFGTYGAMLVFLSCERRRLDPTEFRWMFWGGAGFAAVMLVLGFLIPGIDNAAHVGGLVAGGLTGFVLVRPSVTEGTARRRQQWLAGVGLMLTAAALFASIPEPRYRWSEEEQARGQIREFIGQDARISAQLRAILERGRNEGASFDQLAGRIEADVTTSYERSFDNLSALSINPQAPSAATLESLRRYAEARRDASHELAAGLRAKDERRIREALQAGRLAPNVAREKATAVPPKQKTPP